MEQDTSDMTITKIWFEGERLYGLSNDGRTLWQSLLYYPRLSLPRSGADRYRQNLSHVPRDQCLRLCSPYRNETKPARSLYPRFETPVPQPAGKNPVSTPPTR